MINIDSYSMADVLRMALKDAIREEVNKAKEKAIGELSQAITVACTKVLMNLKNPETLGFLKFSDGTTELKISLDLKGIEQVIKEIGQNL